MGELTYDDIRRATQEAVRDLQNAVFQIRNQTTEIRRSTQILNNMQYQVNDICTRINTLQQQINLIHTAVRTANNNGSNQLTQAVQQRVADLQSRMVVIEEFVQACNEFFSEYAKYIERHVPGTAA